MKILFIVLGALALAKYLIKYVVKTKESLAHHKNQKVFRIYSKTWIDNENFLYDEYGSKIGKFIPTEEKAQA